jgi:hypothetical protein
VPLCQEYVATVKAGTLTSSPHQGQTCAHEVADEDSRVAELDEGRRGCYNVTREVADEDLEELRGPRRRLTKSSRIAWDHAQIGRNDEDSRVAELNCCFS